MIIQGDSFDLIKDLESNSIDLVITSPPYSDIVNYGKQVSIKKPNDYVDWLLPLFNEIYRVLKPSGSFILNINDKCDNKLRNTYIYDLISMNNKETKLKLYDTYIWHKRSGIPNGGPKRFRNNTEFIFHFVKDQNKLKFYMDRVMEEPSEGTKDRAKYNINISDNIAEGIRQTKQIDYKPELVRPDNVFRFRTAGAARDNTIKHPAPFNKELPSYFINLLTDERDLVLDVFAGIGTTNLAALELNRNEIGFELNEKYVKFANDRLSGNETDIYYVNQYSLDGKLLKSYKNNVEAFKDNPSCYSQHDIMRCYNRIGFNTCGGFIWRLEK